jgi:hypothetical protein
VSLAFRDLQARRAFRGCRGRKARLARKVLKERKARLGNRETRGKQVLPGFVLCKPMDQ